MSCTIFQSHFMLDYSIQISNQFYYFRICFQQQYYLKSTQFYTFTSIYNNSRINNNQIMTTQRQTTLTTTTINNLGTSANTSAFSIPQNKDKKQSEKRTSLNDNYLASQISNLNSNQQKHENLTAANQQNKPNLPSNQNKPNLPSNKGINKQVGGALKVLSDNKQKKASESLKQKIFNVLNIQDIIQNLSEGNELSQKELSKISINFLNIIESQNHKKPDIRDKNNYLQLQELKCLETDNQKILITCFWDNIIYQLRTNNPILSQYGCLQAIKLHIRWNKDKYITNGKFNSKIFPQQLFQKINSKFLIHRNTLFFVQVVQSLQKWFQTYFKGMKIIFTEIAKIKRKNSNQMDILKHLNPEKEDQILSNLVQSFIKSLNKVLQTSQQYLYILQNILSSLVLVYQIFPNKLKQNQFQALVQTIENTSQFFNNLPFQSKFRNQVEKLIVQCLMLRPFSPQKWSFGIKRMFKSTKVNMFKPFTLVFDQNNELEQHADDTTISGENWIHYINYMLQNQEVIQNQIKDQFIFSIICKVLKAYSNYFWADAYEFKQIKQYIRNLGQIALECSINKDIRKQKIYQLIRIMICLMGKNNQEKAKSVQYPLSLVTQNAYKVFTQFSRQIFRLSNIQFNNQFLLNQFNDFQIQLQNQEYDMAQNFKLSRYTIVQLYSKIFISQPCFFFQLFKSYGEQYYFIKIILQLITTKIRNDEFNQILFGVLDNLILDPQSRNLIIKIIGELIKEQKLLPKIYSLCQDKLKIQCLSKHAVVLIESGCYNSQWTKNIMSYLFSLSKKLLIPNQTFYVKLLTIIFTRISACKIDIQTSKSLKPYINFEFVCDYIQYILNFKYNRTDKTYTNKILKSNNFKKLCEGLTFINSILLVLIRQTEQKQRYFQFLPQSIKRIFTLNNTQGKHQLHSQDNQPTSYLVGYLVILFNFYQKKNSKVIEVCPDFLNILFQGIQLLLKVSELSQIHYLFKIYNSTSLFNDANQNKQSLFLQRFKNYVQEYQSAEGLQILIIGNLCQFQFAKPVVDKIRIALQKKRLLQHSEVQKKGRILSCLSRYFLFCINYMFKMVVKNYRKQKQKQQQLKEHLQFLLQTLVNYSYSLFNQKGKCKEHLENINQNIYGSFLVLQCFNRRLFIKWIKNYHRLLLHRINFNFKHSQQQYQNKKKTYLFSQQYYKICQMFLSCSQYLSPNQYNQIINIQTLPHSLISFILTLLQQTKFQLINPNITQLTLQLIINALKMYNQTKKSQKQQLQQIFRLVQQKKANLQCHQNLLILQLCLHVYLDKAINWEQLSTNQGYWPLKLNKVYLENQGIQKIFNLLKNYEHKIFFISGCNAIANSIIEYSFDWKLKNNLQKILSLLRSSLKKSSENYCSYQTIWYLQFLQLIFLKQQRHEYELADKIAKFVFTQDYILKRLGLIILKLGQLDKTRSVQWMKFKFNYNDVASSNFSFPQKLQLSQILKLINFLMVSSQWIDQNKEIFLSFINSIMLSAQLFQGLLTNCCQSEPITQQQKIAWNIKVNANQASIKQSGLRKFDKQAINNAFSKINNYFQLTHLIVNLQIASQYIIFILSILKLEKHPIFTYTKYSERDWSNSICLKFLQVFSHQYISLTQSGEYMNQILFNFTQKYYTKSLKLAQQMYFTNSKSLTTFLTSEPKQFRQLIKTDMQLLLEAVCSNLQSMKNGFHNQYQQDYKSLNNIINNIKRELPSESWSEFEFNKYLGLDELKSKNTKMINTLKSRTGKTINNGSQSGSIFFTTYDQK